MEVNKKWYILQFFLDKDENASHAAKIVNGVYGFDIVTVNYMQFWFRRLRSEIFYVKDAPQNKILKAIVDAPWYATNETIHRNLEIKTQDEIIKIRSCS